MYVAPGTGDITQATWTSPALAHTVLADNASTGVAGNACTLAVTVAALADLQVNPPAVTCEYTVAVFAPALEVLNV
jgi:hypothetical protein